MVDGGGGLKPLRRRPVLLWAYLAFGAGAVLASLAFATPNWLASDERLYGHKFVKLGLWEQCFRSMTNERDPFEDTYFVGCRYIFNPWTKDYDRFRDDIILQPFFVAVVVLYTFCFMFMLIACALIALYAICFAPERYLMLFCISADLLVSAFMGTIAVIVFGARGDGRDWMPDPDHNYLSWSFGLAVVGVYLFWVASLLFFIEARRVRRMEWKEEEQHVAYDRPTHSKV